MDLKQRLEKAVEDAYLKAEAHYGRSFIRPEIILSKRMTRTAGMAESIGRTPTALKFSWPILRDNPEEFLLDTPQHEVAHQIVTEFHGDSVRPHGKEWQFVMTEVMGVEANTYHYMKTKAVKTFEYLTAGGDIKELTLIRHNKLQQGKVCSYRWKDGATVSKEDWVK